MALITTKICAECGEEFCAIELQTTCGLCIQKDLDIKSIEHFNELEELTLVERLRKIEKWMYKKQ